MEQKQYVQAFAAGTLDNLAAKINDTFGTRVYERGRFVTGVHALQILMPGSEEEPWRAIVVFTTILSLAD